MAIDDKQRYLNALYVKLVREHMFSIIFRREMSAFDALVREGRSLQIIEH